MDTVRATRMELLSRRKQLQLAEQGHELLETKRRALLQELMDMAGPLTRHLEGLFEAYPKAMLSLALAEAFEGHPELRSAAVAGGRTVNVDFAEEQFWGLRVPTIRTRDIRRAREERGVSPSGLSAGVAAAADDFEELLDRLLQLAPLQVRLERLGREVRKTSRRVNALNQVLIPAIQREIDSISQSLEENEREDLFRLRRLKKRRQSGIGAHR